MFDSSKRPLLPPNIAHLKPYVAGKTIAEVREAYKPERISKLASNENRLGCSPAVQPAVTKALKEIQDYPDPASRQLRMALAEKNSVGPENIVVAAGSESIIGILCRTFFANDDEAITADATFVGFFVQANIRGISLKKVPVTADYRFDLKAMAKAITEHTKMIYIANPNNPTGTYITKREFENFMAEIPDDVLVIMDEAYLEYAVGVDDYPQALDYDYPNVISLRTFSKAYGLAGMRVGYAIGHEKLVEPMLKTKLTFEPAAPAQAAALAALGDQDFISKSRKLVGEGKKKLYHFFDEHDIRYVRSISNSVLMVLSTEEDAKIFTQTMLGKGVILRRVHAFGLPHCVRITIGTQDDMQHFMDTCKEGFAKPHNLPS